MNDQELATNRSTEELRSAVNELRGIIFQREMESIERNKNAVIRRAQQECEEKKESTIRLHKIQQLMLNEMEIPEGMDGYCFRTGRFVQIDHLEEAASVNLSHGKRKLCTGTRSDDSAPAGSSNNDRALSSRSTMPLTTSEPAWEIL